MTPPDSQPSTGTLAASYARKSTADDPGLKDQHLVNAQKAQRDGYVIPESPAFRFEDDDTSGRTTSREDLDRLMNVVISGDAPFDRLYFKDTTREGRFADPRFHSFLQVLFERHGVLICYSDREVQLDFSNGLTPEIFGVYMKDVFESVMSSQELERLKARVTTGMRSWAAKRFYPGARAPYALERWYADEVTGELLERVDETAVVRRDGQRFKLRFREDESVEVVREIFDRLVSGESMRGVAKQLNAGGIPSPGGDDWSAEAIRRIARNPIYHGTLIWGRTTRQGAAALASDTLLDGGDESLLIPQFVLSPPITEQLFREVQQILDRNQARFGKRRRRAQDYPLSQLLKCELCAANFKANTRPNGTRYYTHDRQRNGYTGRCPSLWRSLRSEVVEAAAESLVRDLLQDDRLQRATEAAVDHLLGQATGADHERKIARSEKETARLRRRLRRLVSDRADAETAAEREVCQEQIDDTNRQIEAVQSRTAAERAAHDQLAEVSKQTDRLRARLLDLRKIFDTLGVAEKEQVYQGLIDRIEVHSSLEEITFHITPLD